MSDTPIPDYTDDEQKLVSEHLLHRYGKLVPLQLADTELQLNPESEELTSCPTLYWTERGAHFVVFKVGADRYRCQFFYTEADQYGTGRPEYDDLQECVLTLLRVQADHEGQRGGMFTGATARDFDDESEYKGPSII